jgi:hypothetical protein
VTAPPAVEPFAAPATTTAYGLPYNALHDVYPSSTPNSFTVKFLTDQPCICAMDWAALTGDTTQTGTTSPDAAATTVHSFTVTPGSPPAVGGQQFSFTLRLDNTDTSGLTLRPYNGYLQLVGARTTTNQKALPVRFYTFGGAPPPGAGGTQPGGGGPNIGNWSTYIWAQYNPKQSVYPAP